MLKIEQREQEEVETLEKEITAWRKEYEAKATIARKDRVAAHVKNAADRAALLKTEELRVAEQQKLTTDTHSSLRKAASAQQPPTVGAALLVGAGNPAQALVHPSPPEAIVLPAMATMADLQQFVEGDVNFTGTPEEAGVFARCMMEYMHQKAKTNSTPDASMAGAEEVDFSDFTENETENAASASGTRVKKKYKMTVAARDARLAKRAKGSGKGVSGTK
jgi:hypothetical protein